MPAQMKDVMCPVKGGQIKLRLNYPSQPANAPAIVFIHGGGFAAGSNDTHSRIMRTLCEKAGSLVIGVEYRLAPEYKMEDSISKRMMGCEADGMRKEDRRVIIWPCSLTNRGIS